MFSLYILALLIHAAYSTTPCQDGIEIVSKETKNPQDFIGNWSHVYQWTSFGGNNWKFADIKADHVMQCPGFSIQPINPEYVQAKEAQCKDSHVPFKWVDAKFVLDSSLLMVNEGILVMGENENWIMINCEQIIPIVLKKVSEDYIVMINPEMALTSEMFARRVPTIEELKCVTHNVDVGKGRSGLSRCG